MTRICCLVQSRGAATEIGFAFTNLDTVEFKIGQYSDTPTLGGLLRQLQVFSPQLVRRQRSPSVIASLILQIAHRTDFDDSI